MNLDLAVVGQGAVTPAGIGVDALLHGQPEAAATAPLSRPAESHPVLRVDPKASAFARWQREPRLRRASPITYFLVEAAEQALANVPADEREQTGLIVAYSAGCLVYSRRFFEGIVKQGQKTASPALFPETVFNSPVSHVATVLGLNGAAYAMVGDETAWIAALRTASIWLKLGRVRQVAVLGVEEFDPLALDAYRSAGWLRKKSGTGFVASEGAAGLLVRAAKPDDAVVVTTARDGLIYRSRAGAADAAARLLLDCKAPIFATARHNPLGKIEDAVIADLPRVPNKAAYLGEAFAASAAWNTVRALAALSGESPQIALPIWGLNHQLGLLTLENRK